jgi:nucleoid-associated protein YgaU
MDLPMKRLIPFVLALLISFACGKKEEPVPETPPAPPAAPKMEPSSAPLPPPPSPEPSKASDEKAEPAGSNYIVVRGDTLYDIAKKNGLSYRELAKWNEIKNPRRLRVGQELSLTPPGK